MSGLLSLVATNAVAAAVLSLLACVAGRLLRRPAVVHGLWLLALLKLLTPPVLPLPVLPAWSALLPAPALPLRIPIHPPEEGCTAAPVPDGMTPSCPAATALPARLATVAARSSVRPSADLQPPAPPPGAARVTTSPFRLGTSADRGEATTPVPATAPVDLALAAGTSLAFLGTSAIAAVTLRRFRRFRRLLESAAPAPRAVEERAGEIASRLGLRAAPPVLLVPASVPPMLWPSRGGPRLLLPRRLLAGLTADERDALLAHELAHVRRRDHWVRFVEIAATALFWWYPVTWWARRALRRAEERCCDEWVLRVLPTSAGAYANGLLKSLAFVSGESDPLPVGASGAAPVQDLEARLKEILMTRPLPRLAAPVRVGLAAAALAGLAVFPTHAQSRPAAAGTATIATPAVVAAPSAGAATPVTAVPARAHAVRPGDAKPLVVSPVARGPVAVSADVAPGAAVAGGVAGGVIGGVPGGVLASADLGDAAPEPDDPALAAERRALDEQRRTLQEQQIALERKTLELEARAGQKRLAGDAARLRADGRTAEAERLEKQARLDAKRIELQKRQLDLELENTRLEAEMEKTAEGRPGAADEAQLEHRRQEFETQQRALEAEMEKAQRELEAVEAEGRLDELRRSTGDLEQSLAEHLAALQSALPEAGGQKADIEREIARLQSALDALAAPSTGMKKRMAAPESMKMRQPKPPAAQP